MPKRSGTQEKLRKYKKKIKKLEERHRRVRVLNSSTSTSDSENEKENQGEEETILQIPEEPSTPSVEIEDTADPVADPVTVPDIDPELIGALGEATDASPEFGEDIHPNLTKLWVPLLKKGTQKENREKILKEYLCPNNCQLLQAPKLNEEISAAVPDMVRNRDKNLAASQQQLGSGITAINRAMDILLKTDDKILAMKHLSNGCRILCDLHAMSTQSRIRLLTPSLDKTFLHVIQDTERDETIFGKKLSEKIKAAKAIEKQGLQIKKSVTPKTSTATSSHTTSTRPMYSGNWAAPPRYPSNRGGRGGARKPTMPSTRRPYTAPATNKFSNHNQNKPRAPPQ